MAFDITKKAIPIGISDFKEFNRRNYYYVDKSILIKDILDNRAYVSLFTRPRRFGKTLNLSMIKYFFEKTEEDNSYLFENLKIWEAGERYIDHQGKYPVINLTFKGAKMNTWEETYIELVNSISEEYKRHEYLLDFIKDPRDKILFSKIKDCEATLSDFTRSVKNLCIYLEKYWGQKPIILIDEYDVPIQNSYIQGFYDEAINFIRALLQAALKDNNYLEFAIITGCLRVSKESIFTGLNNLDIYSILDKRYSEHFGFTQIELDEILKYYELEDKKDVLKEWYDGYKFGVSDIYNPWSILKYTSQLQDNKNKLPEAYWVNTSGNDIVKKLILNASDSTKNEIEILINGGTIEKTLNANITYDELDENIENIWSMLFFTGYLTYVKERREKCDVVSYYSLKIPNQELLYVYKAIIRYWFEEKVKEKDLSNLYQSLFDGNEEVLSLEISNILSQSISYYDSGENFYHGFLLGILQNIDNYKIYSNIESGSGRCDIMLEPIKFDNPAIVIELKRTKNRKGLDITCEKALEQIENNKYIERLENEGYDNIIKYGVAFFKKICKVKKA